MCEAMCGTKVLQMPIFCHSEYLALNKCQAKGDYYYCQGDQVASKGGCQEEGLAIQECQVDVPCQEICAAKSTLGCSDPSSSKCVKACNANGEGDFSSCKTEVQTLNQCQASNATACNGEELAIADACVEKVLDVSACLFNSNVFEACDAWCVAAQSMGCGDSCVEGCESALGEEECGDHFDQVMECGFNHGDAACIDNALLPTGSCDDEVVDWHACLAGELE